MYDGVFRSECRLAYMGVPVLLSVTDYFSLRVCIHYSMTSVVVEIRAYDVSIAAAEIPCPACVGLTVYEDTVACRTKWGGIVIKLAVEVFPR